MENLTSQQAADLGKYFLEINGYIEDFRFDSTIPLSNEQKQQLDDLLDQNSRFGQDILALSTKLIMDDVRESMEKIKNITGEIQSTLKTLKNIQKGINIAASVVTLGAAIISKNPGIITGAIKELVNACKA